MKAIKIIFYLLTFPCWVVWLMNSSSGGPKMKQYLWLPEGDTPGVIEKDWRNR